MISIIETELNCKFPEQYKKLVKYCDEPMPEVGIFEYEGGETCISEFFKFTDDQGEEYGILNYRPKNFGLSHNYIPFARDAGDFLICFELSKEREAIVLIDPNERKIYQVAKSFEEFIDSLHD